MYPQNTTTYPFIIHLAPKSIFEYVHVLFCTIIDDDYANSAKNEEWPFHKALKKVTYINYKTFPSLFVSVVSHITRVIGWIKALLKD